MGKRPAQLRKRDFKREQRPTEWLICCEGKSEVIYLNDLVEKLSQLSGKSAEGIHIGLANAECSRRGFQGACGRQHLELLQRVQTCASKFFERRWILFDCDADGQPNIDQLYKNFGNTILLSSDTGVEAAWSIQSFEYWLLSHKSYQESGSKDKIEKNLSITIAETVKQKPICNKKYQNKSGENHCKKETPFVCADKATKKPYYNSLICLGGIASVKTACNNSKRCYTRYQSDIISRRYRAISCCSNVHELIDALAEYFGYKTIMDVPD
ncbi:MAG TPA: RloB family protein [Clostridia bacterium]|nr:RloB family protein [Clostridia bacterium]